MTDTPTVIGINRTQDGSYPSPHSWASPSLLKSAKRELYSLQGENLVDHGHGKNVEEDGQAPEDKERNVSERRLYV